MALAKMNAEKAYTMSPEEFEEHRERETAHREEFAKMYPAVATTIDKHILSNLPADINARQVLIPTQGRNDEEDEKLAEVRKVHRRMAESGVIPATVVNLAPWPVQATGPYLMYPDMTIPECPIGMAYALKTITTYKIDLEDKGGRFGADAITPVAMANDIVSQLRGQKRGGLFCYLGDHNPGEHPPSKNSDLAEMEKARKSLISYMRMRYREAESYFHQPSRSGLRNITDEHRKSAMYLLHYRFITETPDWLTATREAEDVPGTCIKCGTEVGGGFSCSCGYILDPGAAYQAGEIEAEHHSLRRLTREQLDNIGLDFVMTKDEYRDSMREELIEEVESKTPPAPNTPRKHVKKPKAKAKPEAKADNEKKE